MGRALGALQEEVGLQFSSGMIGGIYWFSRPVVRAAWRYRRMTCARFSTRRHP